MKYEYKQAIIIRSDLNMSKGKIASQASHASVLSAYKAFQKDKILFHAWFNEGMRKIVLKVDSESELLDLKKKAGSKGLTVELVRDAGKTEVKPGSITSLGIGPASNKKIDEVIKDLKLL